MLVTCLVWGVTSIISSVVSATTFEGLGLLKRFLLVNEEIVWMCLEVMEESLSSGGEEYQSRMEDEKNRRGNGGVGNKAKKVL